MVELCDGCGKPAEKLKPCIKCRGSRYCNRDCQKADWKTHKACVQTAANNASGGASSGPSIGHNHGYKTGRLQKLDVHISDPFTRLDQGRYLHDRSEKDVFKILIDALRLHEHDVVKFDHAVDEGSVYAGEDSSIKDFRNFLLLATSKPGILPSWWNAEKQKECEAFGESNDEWSLAKKATKEGIKRKYGVDNMPMQLRMFAETIYGRTPGGFDSTGTKGMLVEPERGEMADMHTTLVDMNQLFGR